jgi:hypothetical protein
MTEPGITLAGQRFDHLVYHLALTYSKGRRDDLLFGEPQRGRRNAVWELGERSQPSNAPTARLLKLFTRKAKRYATLCALNTALPT